MNQSIRVLIADDHPLVRKGVSAFMEIREDIHIVGEAVDGEEAVAKAHLLQPEVILMDLQMPKKNGIEAILEIMDWDPKSKVIVLTSFDEDDMVFPALRAGAKGFMLKNSSPLDLVQAIHDVAGGKSWLHPDIALKVVNEFSQKRSDGRAIDKLTDREIEVLKLVAEGLSNQEIAQRLTIQERTVSTHVSNLLDKLHLTNRTQAALFAVKEGLNQPRL